MPPGVLKLFLDWIPISPYREPVERNRRTTLIILVIIRYLDKCWRPTQRVVVACLAQDGFGDAGGSTTRDATFFSHPTHGLVSI